MFNFIKNKKDSVKNSKTICSPVNGKTISLENVNDEVFRSGALGNGIAFISNDGKINSPCEARVATVFDTKHAISLITESGVEILIHFGIDTVELNGEGFEFFVKEEDYVKKGDSLFLGNLELIQSKGYNTTIMMVICNSDDFDSIDIIDGNSEVLIGDNVIEIL